MNDLMIRTYVCLPQIFSAVGLCVLCQGGQLLRAPIVGRCNPTRDSTREQRAEVLSRLKCKARPVVGTASNNVFFFFVQLISFAPTWYILSVSYTREVVVSQIQGRGVISNN